MKIQTLSDLMVDLARDMFDAEKQLVKAFPKMVREASNPHLRKAFETLLGETKLHVNRLEEVLERLGQPIRAKKCRTMQDLIDEGKEVLDLDAPAEVKDAALIASAQKVEHYAIASYGCLHTWAGFLGLHEVKKLVGDSFAESKRTGDLLAEIAENVGAAPSVAG
jgi:ferritin-like metal-binding protein YciE